MQLKVCGWGSARAASADTLSCSSSGTGLCSSGRSLPGARAARAAASRASSGAAAGDIPAASLCRRAIFSSQRCRTSRSAAASPLAAPWSLRCSWASSVPSLLRLVERGHRLRCGEQAARVRVEPQDLGLARLAPAGQEVILDSCGVRVESFRDIWVVRDDSAAITNPSVQPQRV